MIADRHTYDWLIGVVEAWSKRAGHAPIARLDRRAVREFYRAMSATPAKANAVMRMLRILLNFAMAEGVIQDNPAARAKLKGRPPRQAVWKPAELQAFYQAANKNHGRASIGLAALLAVSLGQREGDILRLTWNQYQDGAITIKQRKTGVVVAVPVTQDLRQALAAAPRKAPGMVVSETTDRPYAVDNFRHLFRDIAQAAGLGDNLQFRDLRRTAVVRLAEAGVSTPEIAAITGHSLTHSAAILEVYLPRNSTMARNGIATLEQHRSRTKLEAYPGKLEPELEGVVGAVGLEPTAR